MHISQIKKLLPGWVLLEANIPVDTSSGLVLPPEYSERYPQSGIAVKVGELSEDIVEGDLCVVPDEGTYERGYYQACYLELKDWHERVLASAEVEPVIREAVLDFERNPTTHDKTILVEAIDGDKLTFLASDVLDVGLEDVSNAAMKIEYVGVQMMYLESGGLSKLFYFVREDEILMTVRGWND